MKNTFSLAALCLACCGALMVISTPTVDVNDPTANPLKPEGDKLMTPILNNEKIDTPILNNEKFDTPILDGHKFDTPILGPLSF